MQSPTYLETNGPTYATTASFQAALASVGAATALVDRVVDSRQVRLWLMHMLRRPQGPRQDSRWDPLMACVTACFRVQQYIDQAAISLPSAHSVSF
jgi:hypothetical protein